MIHHTDDHLTVHIGDCREVLRSLPAESVHCVVTSPPYWGLRSYGDDDRMLGLEPTPEAFIAAMVEVFAEVKRVLRNDGTLWLNMGDSYSSIGWKPGGGVSVGSAGPYVRKDYTVRRGKPKSNWATAPESMAGGSGKRGNSATERPTDLGDDPYRLKVKDLVGMPWRLAFALQADGWYLRSDIIWSKPNPMPESVTDRPTKAHEYVFLLTKSARYFYDAEAVREQGEGYGRSANFRDDKYVNNRSFHNDADYGQTKGGGTNSHDGSGRNLRSVWSIATEPYPGAHFATFPQKLVEPCIKAGCPVDGTVLDPFAGSGTTGLVANRLGRRAILIDLSADYIDQAMLRNQQHPLGLIG